MVMNTSKIGVIGAGISGLGAAWALKLSGADVTVFEANDYVGGVFQKKTFLHNSDYVSFDIDCCAGLPNSFNLYTLCARYGLDMFQKGYHLIYDNGQGITWSNMHCTDFLKSVEHECRKFSQEMSRYYLEGALSSLMFQSIADYVHSHGYSDDFVNHCLEPMVRLSLLGNVGDTLNYSLGILPHLFFNSFINFYGVAAPYFSVRDGLSTVTRGLASELSGTIRLSTPVRNVIRGKDKVILIDATGKEEIFDEVIFSTTLDVTSALLGDNLTEEEANLFRNYQSRKTRNVIHTDSKIVGPDLLPVNAYIVHPEISTSISSTVEVGSFLDAPELKGIFRTFHDAKNTSDIIDPKTILDDQSMAWERLVPESLSLKAHLYNLQGKNNTWHCGMSTVYGSIEFALTSGFVIAKQLGAKYPFANNVLAKSNFHKIEDLMLRGFLSL